jgi:hypothetical protein
VDGHIAAQVKRYSQRGPARRFSAPHFGFFAPDNSISAVPSFRMTLTKQDKEQIAILERLPQTLAAELIGMTPRALRYHENAPRNLDGTYSAQALVLWMRLRAAKGEL